MRMDITYIWFLASILFFFVEAVGVSGIGLLFAAIAAFCVGMMLQLEFLDPQNNLSQGAAFFALTAFWALALWKPLKMLKTGKSSKSHHDIVGRTATASEPLTKGKAGHVRWSGTTMRARLADDAAIDAAAIGDELVIVKVDGSTLILAQKDYLQSSSDD
jgi:membrane protein implicated in regulation of membrane protease activity